MTRGFGVARYCYVNSQYEQYDAVINAAYLSRSYSKCCTTCHRETRQLIDDMYRRQELLMRLMEKTKQ